MIRENLWKFNSTKPAGEEKLIVALKNGLMNVNVPGQHSVYYMPATTANLNRAELQIIAHSNKAYNYWSGGGTVKEFILRSQPHFVSQKIQIVPDLVKEGNDYTILSYEPCMSRGESREIHYKEALAPDKIWQGEWVWDYERNAKPQNLIATQMIGGQPSFGGDMLIEPIHPMTEVKYRTVGHIVVDKAKARLEAFQKAVSEGIDHYTAFKDFYKGDIDMMGIDLANIAKAAEFNGGNWGSFYEGIKDAFDNLVGEAEQVFRTQGPDKFSEWINKFIGEDK
jgi:hypothetical protein